LKDLWIKGNKIIELTLLGLVATVVFVEGVKFATTLRQSIGAVEAGAYLIVLALFLIILLFIYGFQPQDLHSIKNTVAKHDRKVGARDVLVCMGLFFSFVLMLRFVDYAIAAFVFFFAYLRFFGHYRWPIVILTSAFVSLGSAYLWHIFGIAMPQRNFFMF